MKSQPNPYDSPLPNIDPKILPEIDDYAVWNKTKWLQSQEYMERYWFVEMTKRQRRNLRSESISTSNSTCSSQDSSPEEIDSDTPPQQLQPRNPMPRMIPPSLRKVGNLT